MAVYDLELYKKSEIVLFRIYPALRNFPKAEKHALCAQIKEQLIEMLKCISLANSVKSKRKTYLQEVDGYLQSIKVLMRLSRNQKYISKGFFEDIDVALSEINRILVGFIKSAG